MQMSEGADAIGEERADRAALVPGRVEHEMLHDELCSALEKIQQAGLAVRALEDVVLLDSHGWQFPTPPRDLLKTSYGLLFSGLQLLACDQPLGGRNDSRTHGVLLAC